MINRVYTVIPWFSDSIFGEGTKKGFLPIGRSGRDGGELKIMSQKVRIVVAEDHTILREGLRSLLCSNPGFEVVGEAEDGREAIKCVAKFKPDLILTDLSMPKMNGMEAIKEIRRESPETKILVLTVHRAEEYILATFRAGADGYILKDSTHSELVMAVKKVVSGKHYISPEISEKVIEGYLEGKKTLKSRTSWEMLTQREREILKLIAEGYKNKEIAEDLCISVKTVEKHRANLMEKLDLHSIQALTTFAIDKGIVSRE
jgi:DNA-binding NarL/FixJ family response regulator